MAAAGTKTKLGKKKRKKKRKFGLATPKGRLSLALGVFIVLCAITAMFPLKKSVGNKQKYSIAYAEEIGKYSKEFSIEPQLVAAVVFTESSGRADAVSPVGAIGLMQIMPTTGEWIAHKLDIDGYSEAMLYQPEINVRFGCWYLHFLLDRYDGNENNAVAAYNAGQGNVDKWLTDPRYGNGNELINIPFEETANYVIKVKDAKEKYFDFFEPNFY